MRHVPQERRVCRGLRGACAKRMRVSRFNEMTAGNLRLGRR